MVFDDRAGAGRFLASKLARYKGSANTIVLALPRGGVPVAYEIGKALDLPIDVFVVRKLGVPNQEELAMGAIASGGLRHINDEIVAQLEISPDVIDAVSNRELEEVQRRERLYRGQRAPVDVRGQGVILVD